MFTIMKKVLILILCWTACLLLSPSSFAQSSPKAVFEAEKLDAGSFPLSDSDYDFVFKYRNEGDSALVIANVIPTCHCITVSFSKEPLMPGDSSAIVARYHARHAGSFSQMLTVVNNSPRRLLRLRLVGKVTSDTPSKEKK